MLFNKKVNGFTLTEVLLAVAIVGILAVLVLPATISKFDASILESGFERQLQTIQTAIDVLPIKENKTNFGETSMYSDGSKTYDESSGKFMRRYLRVSKYYGDYAANEARINRECFARNYYEYSDGEKKDVDISTLLFGACAKLKNGASLCLSPQVGASNSIQGYMDINGPKGPNIIGRDMRKITLGQMAFTNYSSKVSNSVATDVYSTDNPNLSTDEGEPCSANDYSEACCRYFMEKGSITSSSHGCCSNASIASQVPACSRNITIRLNLYPYSCNNSDSSCRVYVNSTNTTAKLNNAGSPLTVLPYNPPNVYMFCDGKNLGYMNGSQLKDAITDNSGTYYYFTKTSSASATCGYQSGQGLKPTKTSIVFDTAGSSVKTQNGVTWTLTYY